MDKLAARNFLADVTQTSAIGMARSLEYNVSHRAILKLANATVDDPKDDNLYALACAVYGWMPTILKKFEPNRFKVKEPIKVVRSVSTRDEAKLFLDKNMNSAPINNSWVGTSKLLYFINPDFFPIWDSRVARCFGVQTKQSPNSKIKYLDYFDFMHDEVEKKHHWVADIAGYISNEYGSVPSDLRCLEISLFNRGRELLKRDK